MRMKVNKLSTNTLTLICGLTGFIILWVGLRVRENGPGTEVTYYTEMLLLVLGFYIWGWMGVVWAVRRDAPQFIRVRGRSAVIVGLILVISAWSIALYAFYLTDIRLLS
jgi:hypothetical protein